MSRFPYINRGMGVLTADVMNDLFDSVLKLEKRVDEFRLQTEAPIWDKITAILTGYQAMAGTENRYEYSWVEAIWSNANSILEVKTNGLNSYDGDFDEGDTAAGTPFTSPAYNVIETGNNGLGWESSVNVEGSAYPQDPAQRFYLQPIRGDDGTGGNTQTGDPGTGPVHWPVGLAIGVFMRLVRDDTGALVYLFSTMNQHDGECSP